MPYFKKALTAWNSDRFDQVFQQEFQQLALDDLPLQAALNSGSYALADDLKLSLHKTLELEDCYQINAGLFFSSVIAGCNCADDPTPVEAQPEYCELQIQLDKQTGQAKISLVS